MRSSAARPPEFPPVLTAALAAELLQVHVESLRKMVREGRVPCHRFPGGREMRFLRDELLEWLAELPGEGQSSPVSRARVSNPCDDALRSSRALLAHPRD